MSCEAEPQLQHVALSVGEDAGHGGPIIAPECLQRGNRKWWMEREAVSFAKLKRWENGQGRP